MTSTVRRNGYDINTEKFGDSQDVHQIGWGIRVGSDVYSCDAFERELGNFKHWRICRGLRSRL